MGESTCLMMQMQPFSYVSGLPCFDPTEGNRDPIRSLGQSISFGRFVSDSVSWEKWSVFSHNRYVEEAERYARPGSVAQKKAFFEAHYREMAARKAAAAAAAAAEAELEAEQVSAASDEARNSLLDEVATGDSAPALDCNDPNGQDEVGETEQCGTPEIEKPLLKDLQQNSGRKEVSFRSGNKKMLAVIPSKSLGLNKAARRQPSTPAKPSNPAVHPRREVYATPRINKKSATDFADGRRTTPKQVPSSTSTPRGGIRSATAMTATRKVGSLRVGGTSSSVQRNCMTPTAKLTSNGTSRKPVATPRSSRTPIVRSVVESKSAGPKGKSLANDSSSKLLSACKSKLQSPGVSTPFKLKTIERSARRKEKLEEKFNADEAQKVQQQAKMVKEKADLELKKFRQTLCFKARPLPKFYKENGTPKKPIAKAPSAWPQSGRKPGLLAIRIMEYSLPAQAHRPNRNNQSKQIQGKREPASISQTSEPFMTTTENKSPNIQEMCS
ncbi:protein WVD2-like 7 isoform X2 [Punica granatum]|uniref:Protein WVD2-like 7 isoform X2 n=1 Tax=Punica granatum TaxID=22663 RepID=A0A6P8E0N4_PUNGR|nr:protein WVD2-like 7 isoform X2 [Punica granatum]